MIEFTKIVKLLLLCCKGTTKLLPSRPDFCFVLFCVTSILIEYSLNNFSLLFILTVLLSSVFQDFSTVCEHIVHCTYGHISGVVGILLHTKVPVHTRQRPTIGESQLKVYVFAIYNIRLIYKILNIIHNTVSHRLLTRSLAPSLRFIQTTVITIIFHFKTTILSENNNMDWHVGTIYFGFLLCYSNIGRPVHRIIYYICLKIIHIFYNNSFSSVKKNLN